MKEGGVTSDLALEVISFMYLLAGRGAHLHRITLDLSPEHNL